MCTSCDLRHRLIIRRLTTTCPGEENAEDAATNFLLECASKHPHELRLSTVDVLNDAVILRCGGCRHNYDVVVAEFETYRKET